MDTDDMRFFARLVEARSLSEAARRWHSSPPAMSRRLAALEDRLGVRLVARSSRHFALTAEGALLVERARRIVAELDDAEAELRQSGAEIRGHLRVGAPMELGRRRIAPLLGAFGGRHPGVTAELVLSDEGQDPLRDALDVVLRTTPPEEDSVIQVNLLRSRRVVCAAPDYAARFGLPETPEALADHRCLVLVRGRRMFDRWRFVRDGAPVEVRVAASLATTSGEVVHDWALAGLGIAWKAAWDIDEDLRAGRLVEALAPFAADAMNLTLVYAAREHLPARVRALIGFLREALA